MIKTVHKVQIAPEASAPDLAGGAPFRHRPRSPVALVIAAFALAGCGHFSPVAPGQKFRLSDEAPLVPRVTVADDRTPAERDQRTYAGALPVPEADMTPDIASYVAQEMTRAIQLSPRRSRLEEVLAGKTVRLRHVEIVAIRSNARLPDQGLLSPAEWALEAGVAGLASGLGYRAQVYVDIDIDVDDGRYISHAVGPLNVSPASDALILPARQAVAALVGRIADGRRSDTATLP